MLWLLLHQLHVHIVHQQSHLDQGHFHCRHKQSSHTTVNEFWLHISNTGLTRLI